MLIVEFVEKVSPILLSEQQKELLVAVAQAKEQGSEIIVCMPPRIGRTLLLKLYEEYEKIK